MILKDPDWEITLKVNYLIQTLKELQKPLK